MTIDEFFSKYDNIAIALSGGVDSVYLMYAAKKSGANVRAYFAKTEFQPEIELRDAQEAAKLCDVPLCVIEFSAFEDENVIENGHERCYHCKKGIMQIIYATALSDGCDVVCEGTNASDDISDRPGYRALEELNILSPLRLCGITKAEVRRIVREEGIPIWNKPSYACLATRIKTGDKITKEALCSVSAAEDFLREKGFSDFRVRVHGDSAKIELTADDMERFIKERKSVIAKMKEYFCSVTLDLEARDEKLSQ